MSASRLPYAEIGLGFLTTAAVYWLLQQSRQVSQIAAAQPEAYNFFTDIATNTVSDVLSSAEDTVFSAVANVTGQQLSRGLQNNNPGNIERDGDPWEGMSPTQNDGRYITFVSAVWGLRAFARILDNYRRRGLVTINQIVSTWAPPAENNTAIYIRNVSRAMNVTPDATLSDDRETMADLMAPMIVQEQGYNPYSRDMILQGIDMSRGNLAV